MYTHTFNFNFSLVSDKKNPKDLCPTEIKNKIQSMLDEYDPAWLVMFLEHVASYQEKIAC